LSRFSDHSPAPCPRESAPGRVRGKRRDRGGRAVCRVGLSIEHLPANSTTKVPAPAPVQSAEASPGESLTKILCPFSTEFSTDMLKTFRPSFADTKAAPAGRLC